ncbi:MAG: hypothetical protein WCJ34_17475 [Alcaligenaceae bacterium]
MKQSIDLFVQPHIRTALLVLAAVVLTSVTACSQRAAPIGNSGNAGAESGPVAMAIPIAAPTDFSSASAAPASEPSAQARPAPFSTPAPEPTTSQMGSAVVVSGGAANLGELKLSLVQSCTPTRSGNTCNLVFIEARAGQDAATLTRDYFSRTGGEATPRTTVESQCSPGWVASVVSQQGSVQGGGMLRAYAAVCGHPNAVSALTAAFNICDSRTQGGCRQSNRVNVLWGRWSADQPGAGTGQPGKPLDASGLASGQRCESGLPLLESVQCGSNAASQLRFFGLP